MTTCFKQDVEHNVLCDEQGIMHSKATIEWMIDLCRKHLEHSDLELMQLGRMSVENNFGPNVVAQFNFEEYYP